MSSSSDEAKAADTETNLTSGGRSRISHGRRRSQGRVSKGINGTVSKAVSSAEPPRRMKRKASVSEKPVSCGVEIVVVLTTSMTRLKVRKDANSRRGGRHEGRNLFRGYLFYDDAYYHLRILGSRD